MNRLITLLGAAAVTLALAAAPIDEAKRLYDQGDYAEAMTRLNTLARKSPRDGNIAYWQGMTALALGDNAAAESALQRAEDRGVAQAALQLATMAADDYRPAEARRRYDSYTALMRKAKKTVPPEVEADQQRMVLMENMMERVEKIQVIDSVIVEADGFFNHYRLSPEAGRIVPGSIVLMPEVEMAYVPQNNTEILYAEPDSTGRFTLHSADILDDGTLDHPRPLPSDDLGMGGNAEYPFMLPDGMTLYYASDGEGSIGGYDIFMTRRTDDGFLQPQNVGMPYNSPYDDYLLAIDETTGAGWWATDRNRIPGMLTIYMFIPADTRVNVDPDDPDIRSLARLDNIALTQDPDRDYTDLLNRVEKTGARQQVKNSYMVAGGGFAIPIGSNDRVYTSLEQFANPEARRAMMQAIEARAEVERIGERLDALRREYSAGNTRDQVTILNLEHQINDARQRQQQSVNRAIALELNGR